MQIATTDVRKLSGILDKFVGLSKEAVGVLINNESLQREGDAQQTKASEKLKALRDTAIADAQRAKARTIGSFQGEGEGNGVLTEVKGKAKQVAASVVDDPELDQEGRADEERGASGRRATQAQAKARVHEAKASAAEKQEELADRSSN